MFSSKMPTDSVFIFELCDATIQILCCFFFCRLYDVSLHLYFLQQFCYCFCQLYQQQVLHKENIQHLITYLHIFLFLSFLPKERIEKILGHLCKSEPGLYELSTLLSCKMFIIKIILPKSYISGISS